MAAIDSYFQGTPPLKEPKIRKDIPDSFIFQNILKLYEEYGNDLLVVVHDGPLRAACEQNKLTCFKQLSDLIEYTPIKLLLQEYIIQANKKDIFKHILSIANANKVAIQNIIDDYLLSNYGGELLYGEYIPGENNEIFVSGVDSLHSLCFDSVEHFGDCLFVVYFSAAVELMYEYTISSSRLQHDDFDFEKYSVTEWLNRHYCDVETTDHFNFKGQIEFEFNINIEEIKNVNDLINDLKNPEMSIDELYDFEILYNNT